MSNYNSLKTTIDANIKQNGRQEITGQILNSVLNQMVTTLGAGYQFAGVATIATEPGTPDAKVFYIANGKGTYEKFDGINVTEDDVVVLYWDSAWHKVSTGIASQEKLSELEKEVVYDVTINNDGATFASLSALLSDENLSTLIPSTVRCGGMSIRFVQSTDNKYVQYRLMKTTWSNVVSDWQGVDEEPTASSANLVKSGGIEKGIKDVNNKATWTIFRNSYYNSNYFALSDDISQYAGKWVAVKFSFTHDDVNKEINFRVSIATPFEGNKVVIDTTIANNEVYLFKMPEVASTCRIGEEGTSDMVMYITTDESVLGKLMFDERNIERAAIIYTPEKYKSNFGLGNVSIESTGWQNQTTLSSYSRIRNNSSFFLNKGDKLITDDGFSFYIGYYKENVYGGIKVPQYTDSENYGGTPGKWLTEYVCTEAGYYKILIKDNAGTNYDSVDTIFSHFRIIRYGNNLDLQEKVDSVEGVANDAINNTKGLLGLSVLYNITGFTINAGSNNKVVVGYTVPKEIIDSTGQYIYINVNTKKFATCRLVFYNRDNGSITNIGSYNNIPANIWYKIFVPIASVKLEYLIYLEKYSYDNSISVTDDITISMTKASYYQAVEEDLYKYNSIIRSGAHRGASDVAPENTAAAFRLARKLGCYFVETDVRETSDGEYVMIHDGTINRTARMYDSETGTWVAPSETLNVADLTLAQLKEYDFGVWKSEDYVGEKIMTLDEFLRLCNYLGLHPYIEQKVDGVSVCIEAIRKNGLVGKATILADYIDQLTNNTLDKELRYGLLVDENTTDATISSLADLMTQGYDVFALIHTNAIIRSEQKYINAKIPLEAYNANPDNYSISNYITGYMTDSGKSIGKIKYERAIGSNRIDFL